MDFAMNSLWTFYRKKWKIFNYRFFFIFIYFYAIHNKENDDLKRRKIYGAKDEEVPSAEPKKVNSSIINVLFYVEML